MWNVVIGALAGAVGGGVINGLTASSNTRKRASAYEDYAKAVREATEKYSGNNAYNAMLNEGSKEGLMMANNFGQNNKPLESGGIAMNNVNTGSKAPEMFDAGRNLGRSTKATELDSKFNADTAAAKLALQQELTEANAQQAGAQAGMNAAGGLVDLAKNTGVTDWIRGKLNKSDENNTSDGNNTSDENQKEGINNDSGLPESDIEDSMRQLETISYKYKDPNIEGCDDEKHDSGFTAQSAEKTPLFKDAVKTGADGIKRIDNWKLLEAVTAGIAQLQREIDELEGNKDDKVTSDERCKEAENAIEANPVQAAQQLPQDSLIQKEAGSNELTNDELDKYFSDERAKVRPYASYYSK